MARSARHPKGSKRSKKAKKGHRKAHRKGHRKSSYIPVGKKGHVKRGCGKHNWRRGGNAHWRCKKGKTHPYKARRK